MRFVLKKLVTILYDLVKIFSVNLFCLFEVHRFGAPGPEGTALPKFLPESSGHLS